MSAFWIGHLQLFSCTVSLCQFVMILTSYIFLPLDLPGCCWSRSDETVSIRWHGAILCVPTEANSSHWFVSMTVGLGGRLSKEWKNKTVASLWKLAWTNISIRPGSIWQLSLTLNSSSCWNLWRCRWIWSALPRLDPCRSAAPAGRAENLGLARNDKYILSYIILIHLSCTTHFQTVMLTSCKKMSFICQLQALSRKCTCARRWWTGKFSGSWAEWLAVSQMYGPNVQMWARLKQAQLPNPQKEAKMTLRLQKRREEEVVVGGSLPWQLDKQWKHMFWGLDWQEGNGMEWS